MNDAINHPTVEAPSAARRGRRERCRLMAVLAIAPVLAGATPSCRRERHDVVPAAGTAGTSSGVVLEGALRPAGLPSTVETALADAVDNGYAMNEGKRLFDAYNCSGCHAHGGGAIGPALMDERWIYGSQPANVFETIVEGRPNGMPAFRGKIPDFQVAELVAYVRSMAGMASKPWAPGRNDALSPGPAENTRDRSATVRQPEVALP